MSCSVCGGPLQRQSKYGICWRSKACAREYRKKWREENSEADKAQKRKWIDKNTIYRTLRRARERAARKGIAFAIGLADIPPIPELCPVLGIKLERSCSGNPGPSSPALDRIVPSLGYVPGNLQWLSHRANIMKSDASAKELLMFAEWVVETYG